MTKATLTAKLLALVTEKFSGMRWSEALEKEVRYTVLAFIAEHGLYPKHLGIAITADGYIEIDADEYVAKEGVN